MRNELKSYVPNKYFTNQLVSSQEKRFKNELLIYCKQINHKQTKVCEFKNNALSICIHILHIQLIDVRTLAKYWN